MANDSTVPASALEAGDRGLVRALGAWGLAAAIANTMIGGGIFRLPAEMAAAVGTAAPLYYLLCAGAVGAVGLCFAEAGSRVAVAGGVSGCVEVAFGRYAGFITAVMLWLGATLAAAGIAAGLADTLAKVAPIFLDPIWRGAFIVLLFVTLASINLGGIRAGGALVWLTMALKLVPLFTLVIVGGMHAAPSRLTGGAPPHADIGQAMILGIFAFMGMETALGASGEVRRPERNVPLGILGSLAAVTVLYILIQLTAEGLLGTALGASKTPLADAMGKVSPALSTLLLAGGAVSMLGYLSADMLTAPRILFGMGRDGVLPKPLAAVHSRLRIPHVAIVVHALINILLAISGGFRELAVLSTLMTIVAYLVGCGAAVVLQRRGVAMEGKPLNFPFTPVAAVVGIVSMIWFSFLGSSVREAEAVAAAIVISSLIYLVSRRFSVAR